MSFTHEQKDTAGRAFREYECRTQQIWDDMLLELSLKLSLDEEQIVKLMEEVA